MINFIVELTQGITYNQWQDSKIIYYVKLWSYYYDPKLNKRIYDNLGLTETQDIKKYCQILYIGENLQSAAKIVATIDSKISNKIFNKKTKNWTQFKHVSSQVVYSANEDYFKNLLLFISNKEDV